MDDVNLAPYNLMDGGAVVIVMLLVNLIKKYFPDRVVPLLPLLLSLPAAVLITYGQFGLDLGIGRWAAVAAWEAIKIATASMSVFKWWHTTVMGK